MPVLGLEVAQLFREQDDGKMIPVPQFGLAFECRLGCVSVFVVWYATKLPSGTFVVCSVGALVL